MVLMEIKRRLCSLQSRRGVLVLLGFTFILAMIGSVSGSIGFALSLNGNVTTTSLRSVPHEISFNLASAILSVILFVGVHLSPSLCEESTMVVHSSLLLFMLHMVGYGCSLGPSVVNFVWVIPAPLSIFLNVFLMLLFAILAIVSCCILRNNESSWPKSQFLRFFTCDCFILLSRLVPAIICVAMRYASFPVAVQCLCQVSVLLNFFLLIENIMTVFWGVVHLKMFGVQNLVVSALLFVTFVVMRIFPLDHKYWSPGTHAWTVWLLVACALPLLHGVLSLRYPHLINAPPNLFKQFWHDSDHHATVENSVATTGSSAATNGSSIYNRLFRSGSFSSLTQEEGSNGSRHVTDVIGHRWTLKQLATRCPPFLRHTIFGCLGLVIVLVNYLGLVLGQYSYSKWGPVVVLCVASCVVVRSLPALLTMLLTRSPLPDPLPLQVAGYVIMESLLGIVGALGTFIDLRPIHSFDVSYIFTGILVLFMAVLQFLHVNGLVRGMKIEATAATSV
ncbi:hypothetical protein FHG87_011559 [Trinorchestia longiramus]|nr:hypothetical protein FHG87_011559 [Trinorchestia longiramus]